jgi:predicted PurR-regulated permease PerM
VHRNLAGFFFIVAGRTELVYIGRRLSTPVQEIPPMLFDAKPFTFDRVVRVAFWAGLLGGSIWLLGYLSDVLIPFAIALLMAYLLNPLVLTLQKRVHSRPLAVTLALLLSVLSLTVLLSLLLPRVTAELVQMGRFAASLVEGTSLSEAAARRLPPVLWQSLQDWAARSDLPALLAGENMLRLAEEVAQKLIPWLWSLVSGTANFFVGLLGLSIIALYFVFLLLDYPKISQGWRGLLPEAWRGEAGAFVDEFETAMSRYFRAQAAVAALVGVLFAIGFALIGLPMGILLGLLIGLLNMIPYLQLLALPPALLLALFHALETGQSFLLVLGLTALVFVVVQLIQDALLVPKIMGKVTGLNPAMILLSLSIWGKLLGLFGLLIALPMTCLLLAYYRRLLVKTATPTPSPEAVPVSD